MKKFIIPALCFGLGILVYHLLAPKPNLQGSVTKELKFGPLAAADTNLQEIKANRIERKLASRLIREFQQNASYHGLITVKNQPLKGFFIDSAALHNILRQPGCNGVRIYFGMDDRIVDMNKKIYTLFFIGTYKDPTFKTNDTLDMPGNEVYEYVDPCPDNCDDSDGALDHPTTP